MSNSAGDRATIPQTLWAARGRHTGPAPEDVVRRTLRRHKHSGDIDDFAEPPSAGDPEPRVFEARWRAGGTVTVRARLTLVPCQGRLQGHEWRLVAEAERPWDDAWPSPATLFWPESGSGEGEDGSWDHHPTIAGLRFRQVNALPEDDKDMRRLLRDAAREAWCVHVVVHEAMTPDEQGRLPLARLLPPGLRHRVMEHRAAPQQLRGVNWALKDLGVEVPRGGAVLLPPDPAPEDGYDGREHSVRSVFLDGSEPAELVTALRHFVALPRPLPQGAEEALTDLRDNWTLMTLQEQLERERRLVAMYAEALEAMTKSRDLYKQAAEEALEALAAYRDVPVPAVPQQRPAARTPTALQQLTRTFERLKLTAKGRQQAGPAPDVSPDGTPAGAPSGAPAGPAREAGQGGATDEDADDRSS
ncbi:hypothetical protein KBP30_05095 [Streptomyces sp. Go40/10]|uniref:hypothetical protein n=1 Tax=Streptomyces sp. Go40/10 TaxID=2825844 RepID=UPI001E5239E7|nr:hypothetical protein [Streptomyces sp. Go40/10]UFR00591.1 hypothetical protein KBP30_05095 [Streptomyces sp. Go40/10]